MKRWAIVLLTLTAVPALADPDPDDTTEQPVKKKKTKKKPVKTDKKKKKKKKEVVEDEPPAQKPEIDMAEDPTTKPAPTPAVTVDSSAGLTASPDDPNAAAMAKPTETPLATGTPIELTRRPLVFQKGRVDVGGYIAIPRGPDYNDTQANAPIGKWIGMNLRGEFGVGSKVGIGATIALAPLNSSNNDEPTSKLGGFIADLKYALIDDLATGGKDPLQLAAHLSLGMLKRGAAELGPYAFPLFGPDLEPTFGIGLMLQKTLADDKLAIYADPRLFVQASGYATLDPQMMLQLDAFISLQVPLGLAYQVKPNVALGLHTGIYTGQKVSFAPNDGLAIPAVAEAVVTVMKNQLDVGIDLGLGNLTPARGAGPAETFLVGLFATYRTK